MSEPNRKLSIQETHNLAVIPRMNGGTNLRAGVERAYLAIEHRKT